MNLILKNIIFTFLCMNFLSAQIILDDKSKEIVLLNKSDIYFDKSNKETIETLIQKPTLFESYHNDYINNGLDNKYPVWIKFTLFNPTSKIQNRTISIDEIQIEHLELYTVKEGKVLDMKQAGSLHREEFKGILRPNFNIFIPPQEELVYYLKVYTPSFGLFFKVMLSSYEDFIYSDIKYHLIWAVFIVIILTVFIYNIFIFLLTRDSIYFYYALYILGILSLKKVHYLILLHIFPMHDPSAIALEISLIVYFTNFMAITMILFTQNFLETKHYPRLNQFLNFLLIVIIIHSLVTSPTFLNYQDVALFYLLLLFFFFLVGLYTLYKKNKNALYFVFGWGLSVAAWVSTLLHGLGIWSVKYKFYYITETFIVLEVFLFSYAIAKYIRKLNIAKEQLSQELVEQKKNENIRLEHEVTEKTAYLNSELKTNTFLLQELNHRVKNNMQFITSLYALKLGDNMDVQDKLRDVERKVLAMSQVHQMLYTQKNLDHIEADDYFETIIRNIQEGFNKENIKFIYNIQITLKLEEAIYCGLIVNELVTNAVKYAFPNKKGEITIILTEDDDFKYLKVGDNGIGIQKNDTGGFGQILIETLATQQLNGKVHINTTNGTQVEIFFPKI